MAAKDLELLEAWKSGEVAAGEELVERHFDAVYRFVRGKVADSARDLTQEAFLACVEGRFRFRGGASFRTYLFGAAKRIVYRYWTQRSRANEVDLSAASLHDLHPSPASGLEGRRERRLLVRALRRLPLEFQIAIELYYMEGLKSREIAEILDVPHATVRSRLRRGLEQARRLVEELAASGDDLSTTISRIEQWAEQLGPRPGSAPSA